MKKLALTSLISLACFALAANNVVGAKGYGVVANPRGKTMEVKFDFLRSGAYPFRYTGSGTLFMNMMRNYLPGTTEMWFSAPKTLVKNGYDAVVECPVKIRIKTAAELIESSGTARLTVSDLHRANALTGKDKLRIQIQAPNVPPMDWTGEWQSGEAEVFERAQI